MNYKHSFHLRIPLIVLGILAALLLSACMPQPGVMLPATPPPTPFMPTGQPALATAQPVPTLPSDGTYDVLFRIPKGPEGVTYQGEGMPEMQIVGPAALAVGPDGSFWVLDTLAQRILRYNPAGERLAILALEDQPRALSDLAVSANALYVLDGWPTPPEVLRLSYDGQVSARYPLPPNYTLSDGVTGLGLDADGAPLIELFLRSRWARLLDANGAVAPAPLPGLSSGGITFNARPAGLNQPDRDLSQGEIIAGEVRIPVSVTHTLGGLSLLSFAPDGSVLVELQELIDGAVFQVDQTVRRYTPDGQLLGMALVPLGAQYAPVSHALAVAPDGAVYALGTRPDGAGILRLQFVDSLPPLAKPVLTEPTPAPSATPAAGPQDPDPATIAVVGLLDAWMRGEDVRPYLALNLRAEAEAGRPLDQILGLHPITLESYAVGAPISRPEQTGFYVIPALLSYQGFSEERLFTVTVEGHEWRISATAPGGS